MTRVAVGFLGYFLTLGSLVGCANDPLARPTSRTPVDQLLFSPASMRLHPVFTQVRDWTGDGKPDGIEAVVEIQDAFGDPTKAAGRLIFELYEHRPQNPDPRGRRLENPWEGRLDSMEDQRARYNRVNRAYIFQLEFADIKTSDSYVLTASFELSAGGRFFDRTIIQGQRDKPTPAPGPAPMGPATTTPDSGKIITTQPTGSTRSSSTNPNGNQEPSSVPTTSHMPPARIDQP